jgi:hypothetical protein
LHPEWLDSTAKSRSAMAYFCGLSGPVAPRFIQSDSKPLLFQWA